MIYRDPSAGTRSLQFFLGIINKAATVSELTQAHAQLIRSGHSNNLIAVTKLTQSFSAPHQDISIARRIVNAFNRPDLFLYNVLIRGFSQNGLPIESLSIFLRLRCSKTRLEPDNYSYAFVISGISSSGDQRFGLLLHGQAVVSGYCSDLFVGSALVDMYMSFGRTGNARKVFDRIACPDTVLWNTMVAGLSKNFCFNEAIRVFRDMVGSGIKYDAATLAVVLTSVAELQALQMGKTVHCLSIKVGCFFHDFVLTGLISAYSRCRDVKTGWLLFEQIRKPDLIPFNAMIAGFAFNNETESSVRLFKDLLASREKVNSSTIVGLIPVSSPFGHLDLCFSIHGLCVKTYIIRNPSVSTALTTAYSRLNELEFARKLFDESSERTLASWNAMISGYAQNGQTEMAISLFLEMQKLGIHPNPITITSILSACSQLGALSIGRWIHELIKNETLESNIYVLTALVDMYAKCGNIETARQLFDTMLERNAVTWNAMISGYGLHGFGRESLMLFDRMLSSGVYPTEVTFLSLLYACSHAGLVEEGENIFHSMVHYHGIKPSSEHYACMVDLLGRAGKLEKALNFIERMPVEPGPAEWGALLGACKTHKNTNLANFVSGKLFNLDAVNVGYYVLLANIHSTDHNYPRAASVRQMVKKRNLAKTPGCTLIEVDGYPYVFKSSDQSHPQSGAIYSKLEEMMEKMREAGFQVETSTALHDVEEEEKELMVKVHSEKLAISFGLIASEPGSEIRIVKNLRVCIDCHSFTRYISKLTGRVIVVRDANRFHHFKDGICSCGDYW
ncbi:hypothetical protein DM860_013567 [Cuscuta australis]|uniref:DYW domain-containing protein n=1 Tax=Cuscuta australis TaxID=267555 RepID=A0A328EER4_9ASTE|nr:hypothetical protein DM860_013567 [Cuscuta australis]